MGKRANLNGAPIPLMRISTEMENPNMIRTRSSPRQNTVQAMAASQKTNNQLSSSPLRRVMKCLDLMGETTSNRLP